MSNRIMVRGEDGMLFCFKNFIQDEDLEKQLDEAEYDYPCAQIWTEEEGVFFYDNENENW